MVSLPLINSCIDNELFLKNCCYIHQAKEIDGDKRRLVYKTKYEVNIQCHLRVVENIAVHLLMQ